MPALKFIVHAPKLPRGNGGDCPYDYCTGVLLEVAVATHLVGEFAYQVKQAGFISRSKLQKSCKNLACLPSPVMPQDFSHQNLRGRCFKGQDLTGANFSHSDIRGANFTNAILRNAKFINAKAGLQRRWAVGLVIGSILLAALSEVTAAFIGGIAGASLIGDNHPLRSFVSVVLLITLALFYVVTIHQGLVAALETIFWAMAVMVTLYAAGTVVIAIAVVATAAGPAAVAQAWTFAGTIGGTVVTVGALALALGEIVILLAIFPLVVAQAWTVAGAIGRILVTVGAVAGAMFGVFPWLLHWLGLQTVRIGLLGPESLSELPNMAAEILGTVGTMTWPVAMGRLSCVSWRFLAGDKKHVFVWRLAIALAAIGSTKFRGADLTDADFTLATLKNTDFRRANLTRCCWERANSWQVPRLDPVQLVGSYLALWLQVPRLDPVQLAGSYLACERPISVSTINVPLQQNRDE